MKRTLLVPALPVVTAAMLVACAGHDAGPTSTAMPALDSSSAVLEQPTRPAKPVGPGNFAAMPESTPAATPEPTPVAMPTRLPPATPPPPRLPKSDVEISLANLGPLDFADYPDDVVFLTEYRPPYMFSSILIRIYRGQMPTDVMAEALFSPLTVPDRLGIEGRLMNYAANRDASSIVITICVEESCAFDLKYGSGIEDFDPGRTVLYESKDGGVTWKRWISFDLPWVAIKVLDPEENEGDRLVLQAQTPFEDRGEDGIATYPDSILWPSARPAGDLESERRFFGIGNGDYLFELPDGRIAMLGLKTFMIYGNLMQDRKLEDALLLPMPASLLDLDRTTAEELSDEWVHPALAIQPGPFLRVAGVDDSCLNIRTDPGLYGPILTCVTQHVLLQDRGESVEVDGITWRKAKTPAGVLGWADGRYLE